MSLGFKASLSQSPSSLTDNVLLASLSAMLFSWMLLSGPAMLTPQVEQFLATASQNLEGVEAAWHWVCQTIVRPLLQQIDIRDHLVHWFARGLIDSGHVAFYAIGTVFFLFITTRSLESRRWR